MTNFPPPQEILDHPQGHLVYSCRPTKVKPRFTGEKAEDRPIDGWTVRLHSTHYPWNTHGAYAKTPVEALELAIATEVSRAVEYGVASRMGFIPIEQRREHMEKAHGWATRPSAGHKRLMRPLAWFGS